MNAIYNNSVSKCSRFDEDEDEDEATGREEEEEEEAFASQEAFSDSDVKHVMSKIASLEEDRLKLLHTIDQLQTDNQQVRPVVPAPRLQPPLCTWRLKVKWPCKPNTL